MEWLSSLKKFGENMAMDNLFEQFQRHLSSLGGEVFYTQETAQAADLIAARAASANNSIVVPPAAASPDATPALWQQVVPLLRDRGITIIEASDAKSVADAPLGLSDADLAIAETGSVLLAENALAARIVSMLTLTHIVLVPERRIVPMLDNAGARLRELTRTGPDQRHYLSFVTGPSRTSDIERVLTIGVQGPKTLCVIVVKS
jgi:L-lactate dehydrogenase complex protein LldG